jgi:ubiquinone/menaquinone biosynthesis C-methylase UbiE
MRQLLVARAALGPLGPARGLQGRSGNLTTIQEEFTRQATVFEGGWGLRMKRDNKEIMGWVLGQLGELPPATAALDVATGTGIFARALAPHCSSVVGLDATEAMLAEARARAAEEQLANIRFEQGDATAMPFPAGAFGLVTCRLAVHHFPAPGRILREMARVLAPGGSLAIVDLVSPADPAQVAGVQFNPVHTAKPGCGA